VKKLDISQVIEALDETVAPGVSTMAKQELIALMDRVCELLAKEIGVKNLGTTYDKEGLICSFKPLENNDPCPDILERMDDEGGWGASSQKTVLLVDDDTNLLLLAGTVIESLGIEVLKASSAEEAWALYESRQIDLLITDIVLPGEDGLSLARRIYRSEAVRKGQRSKIITISGETREEVAKRSLEHLGGTMHLKKPLDWKKLAELVALLCPVETGQPRFSGALHAVKD
jgi:two-component system OmpR family response regulator